jgi:hypothetical protein
MRLYDIEFDGSAALLAGFIFVPSCLDQDQVQAFTFLLKSKNVKACTHLWLMP